MAKIHCPGCKQVLEHDRGFLPLHMTDLQRGELVTGSKVCDYSSRKVVTEKAKITYAHECDNCGVQMEVSVEEDYPGAFTEGIKPFIDVNCIGCSTNHDGYYCSNNGCGLEVIEKTAPFYRVMDLGGQRLPVFEADGKTRPKHRDFDVEADALTFLDSLPEAVDPSSDYVVEGMDPGWYEVPRSGDDSVGLTECRAAVLDPKAMLMSGGSSTHQGEFRAKHEEKVRVTDGHVIAEEPEPGEEPVETVTAAPDEVFICDCCKLGRAELPYHHDGADNTGTAIVPRSWDYCEECELAGCDLIDCEVRNTARRATANH